MPLLPRPTHPDAPEPEVVVGLVNDGMALGVALRGVELAGRLGASIRFVQVVPVGLDSPERAEAESSTFAAGLRALRHGKHRGATFESPGGDPAALLVARSAKAVGLVVGQDRSGDEATAGAIGVAAYCSAHARCPVHVVPRNRVPATSRDQRHWDTMRSDPTVRNEPPVTRAEGQGPAGSALTAPPDARQGE
jgi:nucleotide-binding universal stress UspA family protein